MGQRKLRVIDLFSGGGGASEGYRQAGFEVVAAYDNWRPAVETHHRNHPDCDSQIGDVMKLTWQELAAYEPDVLIGSPPCTQFSFANRGGGGDIEAGLELVHRFLYLVVKLQREIGLRWWVMENVPRVANFVPEEVPLRWLGIDDDGALPIPDRAVLNSADFGAPQRRRRFFAGRFPVPEPTHGPGRTPYLTLGDVIEGLPDPLGEPDERLVVDPVHPTFALPANELNDHFYDTYFDDDEVRENRKAKVDHSWYGKMAFPDPLDRPCRTIMATFMRTSRETIIVEDPRHPGAYRHLTVREAASVQGFPISYQLWGSSLSQRYKLIGNAVPPPLARAIARSILSEAAGDDPAIFVPERPVIERPAELAPDVTHTAKGRSAAQLAPDRRFRDHLPGSKLGGFRVDLENRDGSGDLAWTCKLYVGSGSATRSQEVSSAEAEAALRSSSGLFADASRIEDAMETIRSQVSQLDLDGWQVQAAHARRGDGPTPLQVLERLAELVEKAEARSGLEGVDLEPAAGPRLLRRRPSVPVRVMLGLYAVALAAEALDSSMRPAAVSQS